MGVTSTTFQVLQRMPECPPCWYIALWSFCPVAACHSRLHTRKAGVVHVFLRVCQEKMSGWHQLIESTRACAHACTCAQRAPSIWPCLLAQQQPNKGQGDKPGAIDFHLCPQWETNSLQVLSVVCMRPHLLPVGNMLTLVEPSGDKALVVLRKAWPASRCFSHSSWGTAPYPGSAFWVVARLLSLCSGCGKIHGGKGGDCH